MTGDLRSVLEWGLQSLTYNPCVDFGIDTFSPILCFVGSSTSSSRQTFQTSFSLDRSLQQQTYHTMHPTQSSNSNPTLNVCIVSQFVIRNGTRRREYTPFVLRLSARPRTDWIERRFA